MVLLFAYKVYKNCTRVGFVLVSNKLYKSYIHILYVHTYKHTHNTFIVSAFGYWSSFHSKCHKNILHAQILCRGRNILQAPPVLWTNSVHECVPGATLPMQCKSVSQPKNFFFFFWKSFILKDAFGPSWGPIIDKTQNELEMHLRLCPQIITAGGWFLVLTPLSWWIVQSVWASLAPRQRGCFTLCLWSWEYSLHGWVAGSELS